MSLLVQAGIDQCMRYYAIKDDEIPTGFGTDKDFFVGSKRHVTLTVKNGGTVQVRDIVVLGSLTINPKTMDDTSERGNLVFRDLFSSGQLNITSVNLEGRNCCILENNQKFKKELEDILIDWFMYQRETVNKMGLKSVLVA